MKCMLFALICCSAAIALATNPALDARVQFEQWTVRYSREYPTAEAWQEAFSNFQASMVRVAAQNAESSQSGVLNAATFSLNKFADLSPAQFAERYLTLRTSNLPKAENVLTRAQVPRASGVSIDWRDQGKVTDVKDQGQCGSCWAFSVTQTVESRFAIERNTTPPVLAPEQLVDCDKTDWGCDGGIAEYAWKDVVKKGGIMAEKDYPYTAGKTGRAGSCKFSTGAIAATVSKFSWVGTPCQYVGDSCDDQDDSLVQDAVIANGPLAICVNANWQDYSGGVFSGSCKHDAGSMNHAVQLVGFNGEQGYWIVRNSWASDWGANGYIFIKQGGNLCGVANIVSYPSTI